jgi:hypothetical protein
LRSAPVEPDQPLADVLAAIKAGDRVGSALDAVENVLAIAQEALATQAASRGTAPSWREAGSLAPEIDNDRKVPSRSFGRAPLF